MIKFTSLSQLQKHLQQHLTNKIAKEQRLKDVVADEMSQAVYDIVYAAYPNPIVYERRMDEGGLSDVRNVELTSIEVENNQIKLTIENLTEGQDNMQGKFITDTIEEGRKGNFNNPNGIWAEPRPFIKETVERLNRNPKELTKALKQSLKEIGFDVK